MLVIIPEKPVVNYFVELNNIGKVINSPAILLNQSCQDILPEAIDSDMLARLLLNIEIPMAACAAPLNAVVRFYPKLFILNAPFLSFSMSLSASAVVYLKFL
jgi:hypothetical protein